MSKNAQKKINKLVKTGLKDKIQEAAEKLVTEQVQRREEKLKADLWKTSRQRDWFIIVSGIALIGNFAWFLAWFLK